MSLRRFYKEIISSTLKQERSRKRKDDLYLCRVQPKVKGMRWKRWQRHLMKTYRDTFERWRQWGVKVARGEAIPPNIEFRDDRLPLSRGCWAAYHLGKHEEEFRIRSHKSSNIVFDAS